MRILCGLLFQSYPLLSDLCSLGSIVRLGRLFEPGMVQSLLRRDTRARVINKDLLEKIQEILQEDGVCRNYILTDVSVSDSCKTKRASDLRSNVSWP